MPAHYQTSSSLSMDYYTHHSPSPPTPTDHLADARHRLAPRPYPSGLPEQQQQHVAHHPPLDPPPPALTSLQYPSPQDGRDSPTHQPSSSHSAYPYTHNHHPVMRAPSSVQAPASYHAYSPTQPHQPLHPHHPDSHSQNHSPHHHLSSADHSVTLSHHDHLPSPSSATLRMYKKQGKEIEKEQRRNEKS